MNLAYPQTAMQGDSMRPDLSVREAAWSVALLLGRETAQKRAALDVHGLN